MKRSISKRRREFLAFLGAFPMGLLSARSNAQPRQLVLTCSFNPGLQADGAQLLADKIAQAAAGTIQVSVETGMSMPLEATAGMTALVVYCAPCVAKSEPVLNLSTLPM